MKNVEKSKTHYFCVALRVVNSKKPTKYFITILGYKYNTYGSSLVLCTCNCEHRKKI